MAPLLYYYTGQKADPTGLYYDNARDDDPSLGQFVSSDTIVPDASRVGDYNRYMYGRGNPLKFNDPSGHQTNCMYNDNSIDCSGSPITGGETLELNLDVELVEIESSDANSEVSYNRVQEVGGHVLDALLLPGAYSVGPTISAGLGVDVTASIPLISMDEHGNVVVGGLEIGGGGTTGINIDRGVYFQHMPTASNVEALEAWTTYAGLAFGEGAYISGEVNVANDPVTGEPIFGYVVSGGGPAVKANYPVLPLEFYGGETYTWHTPFRFNLYKFFNLPAPEGE